MKRKFIITRLQEQVITAVMEDETVVELHCSEKISPKETPELGDIYIGKVKNIVANIKAAFVEIMPGVECYYPMEEGCTPIFTNKIGKKPLCIGDEILVQVSREAVKTKVPTVTGKLNFTGKYAVLTYGDTRVGISSKVSKGKRDELYSLATPYVTEDYGFIIRTNAKEISPELLQEELCRLKAEYERIREIASARVCYSCLLKAPASYLTELRNIYQEGLTDIVIEDKALYAEVKSYMEKYQPEDLAKLRLYEDALLPLHKLYGIEKHLADALKEHVWLKSGAYLVIQPTEALTVIDVNTGKCVSKKKDEQAWLTINMEAAKEAARQIRLRNLSGIILIDFINMKESDLTGELLSYLQKELRKDPVETVLVDMTKLQLVEITRKKIRKPLRETYQHER